MLTELEITVDLWKLPDQILNMSGQLHTVMDTIFEYFINTLWLLPLKFLFIHQRSSNKLFDLFFFCQGSCRRFTRVCGNFESRTWSKQKEGESSQGKKCILTNQTATVEDNSLLLQQWLQCTYHYFDLTEESGHWYGWSERRGSGESNSSHETSCGETSGREWSVKEDCWSRRPSVWWSVKGK